MCQVQTWAERAMAGYLSITAATATAASAARL
jgi:hypothetical protein